MSGLPVYTYLKPSKVFTCLGRLLCFMGRKISKPYMLFTSHLIIILLLSFPFSAWAEKSSGIDLTPAEQAWLAEHQEIVLGAPTDYPPMVIKKNDGTHIGVLVDIFEQVSKHLNSTVRMHIEDSWGDVQEKAQTGRSMVWP